MPGGPKVIENGSTDQELKASIRNRNGWSKKTETLPIGGSMLPRHDLLELHKRVLERVRKMTPEEGFRSLVASGIYTPEGKLAKEYGG